MSGGSRSSPNKGEGAAEETPPENRISVSQEADGEEKQDFEGAYLGLQQLSFPRASVCTCVCARACDCTCARVHSLPLRSQGGWGGAVVLLAFLLPRSGSLASSS